MKQEITIYAISDSLGGTSQKLLSAVMAQYPDLIFNNSYRFPFINKESELLDILQDAIKDDAVVISTLVDSHLAATAREFSRVNHLSYLDLMNPLRIFGVRPCDSRSFSDFQDSAQHLFS